jgi:hypothetical protein
MINHRRTGSTIERLSHVIGSKTLVYEKTFDCSNDIVFTPNDVAVVEYDKFYVTNVPITSSGVDFRTMLH